ncbi:MAG: hypothetical protein KA715_13555 [Xanthomonadaceae bacterium]|nr:hypothetical protein [Xanthomonadaceae bacterium]
MKQVLIFTCLVSLTANAGEHVKVHQKTEFKNFQCESPIFLQLPYDVLNRININDKRPMNDSTRVADLKDDLEDNTNEGYIHGVDPKNPGNIIPPVGQCTAKVTQTNTIETQNTKIAEWEKQKTNGLLKKNGKTNYTFLTMLLFSLPEPGTSGLIDHLRVNKLTGTNGEKLFIAFDLKSDQSFLPDTWKQMLSSILPPVSEIHLTADLSEQNKKDLNEYFYNQQLNTLPKLDGSQHKLDLTFPMPDSKINMVKVLIRDYELSSQVADQQIQVRVLPGSKEYGNSITNFPDLMSETIYDAEILEIGEDVKP